MLSKVFFILALLCAFTPVCAQTISSLSQFSSDQHKADEYTNEKTMAVLVELKTKKKIKTSGATKKAGGWQKLEDYIDSVQSKAISQFGWQNFNDVIRYKTQATLAKSVTKTQLKNLLSSQSVKQVFKDEFRQLNLKTSITQIEADKLSSKSSVGSGVAVAILDTGVDASHPFLNDKVVAEACFSQLKSCPNGQTKMEGRGAGQPCRGDCSHGTHVAGIVAGISREMQGVAKSANIVSVQVFSIQMGKVGSMDSDILSGLEWVFFNHKRYNIKAVNMSLGGGAFPEHCDHMSPFKMMIDLLKEQNVAVIVASGNEYLVDAIALPACISSAISVGSINKDFSISDFSNAYRQLDILAPGGDILSSVPGDSYKAMSGTSMAAPHVAGAWALLASLYPDASTLQIESALKRSGKSYQDPRNRLFFPMLNVNQAAQWLAKTNQVAPPETNGSNESDHRIDGIHMHKKSSKNKKIKW